MPESAAVFAHEEGPSDEYADEVQSLYEQIDAQIQAALLAAATSGLLARPGFIEQQSASIETLCRAARERVLPGLAAQLRDGYLRGMWMAQAKILDAQQRARSRRTTPSPATPPTPPATPSRPPAGAPSSTELRREAIKAQSRTITVDAFDEPGFKRPTAVNERQLAVLIENVSQKMSEVERLVGRRTDDILRRIALEELTKGKTAGESRRDLTKRLERAYTNAGVTHTGTKTNVGNVRLINVGGRNLQMADYAGMVARTTPREAASYANRQVCAEREIDLVQVTSHVGACDVCMAYDGKIFSVSGETPGYPVIDQMPPFHPRCRHVETPYIPI